MKIKLAWMLLCAALLIACNSENAVKEKESYNAAKESLLKKEEKNPATFITVSGSSKKNIVGQTVVKGTLVNKASIATFKDVNIKLSFYSRTKALLETDKETIFEILNPGESQDFKTKYFAPKGTDSVGLQVLGAKVIQP
ncbi:MAG TPA: hypothetical protein VLS85_05115 [Hanamia sp.]|nr:hypothetical protein [Hanamia sp.]